MATALEKLCDELYIGEAGAAKSAMNAGDNSKVFHDCLTTLEILKAERDEAVAQAEHDRRRAEMWKAEMMQAVARLVAARDAIEAVTKARCAEAVQEYKHDVTGRRIAAEEDDNCADDATVAHLRGKHEALQRAEDMIRALPTERLRVVREAPSVASYCPWCGCMSPRTYNHKVGCPGMHRPVSGFVGTASKTPVHVVYEEATDE